MVDVDLSDAPRIDALAGVWVALPMIAQDFLASEAGATSSEYALILGIIVTAIVAALTNLGHTLAGALNSTTNGFNSAS